MHAVLAALVVLAELAVLVVVLPSPIGSSNSANTKGYRPDSHRTTSSIFRYRLDYESCLETSSASNIFCAVVVYCADGGVRFYKHVMFDMYSHPANHRRRIAPSAKLHISSFFLYRFMCVSQDPAWKTLTKSQNTLLPHKKTKRGEL